MRKRSDKVFHGVMGGLCVVSVLLLAFLIFFLAKESLPALREVGLSGLLLEDRWQPILYRDAPGYGLRNMLLSTLYVSALAVVLALTAGVGCALFLACWATEGQRAVILPYIDLLASVPSVVYGFVGLHTVVRLLEALGRAAGESILAGGMVLSVMILPYMISSCCETMVRLRHRYDIPSRSLGVSRRYLAGQLVLPAARRGILISMALATGRAMGETMAVMMVLGNAMAVPTLLGKGETIAALISLEMGMAQVGSVHFSALFFAGFALMVLLAAINLLFELLKRTLSREGCL